MAEYEKKSEKSFCRMVAISFAMGKETMTFIIAL